MRTPVNRVRERYGLGARPVILCAARFVPRKGQDTLIRALPAVLRAVPDAVLLLTGDGPYARTLHRLAADTGVAHAVVLAGGRPHPEMPEHYAAADVFAMPCRTRRRGLEVEGLGIVFLEAAAAGLPVLVGDSGGAPDTVRDGETGYVVDGRDTAAVADRLVALLRDRAAAAAMGERGRAWVREAWGGTGRTRPWPGCCGPDRATGARAARRDSAPRARQAGGPDPVFVRRTPYGTDSDSDKDRDHDRWHPRGHRPHPCPRRPAAAGLRGLDVTGGLRRLVRGRGGRPPGPGDDGRTARGSWRLVIVMPGVEMLFHGVYREVSEPDGLVFTLKDGSAPRTPRARP